MSNAWLSTAYKILLKVHVLNDKTVISDYHRDIERIDLLSVTFKRNIFGPRDEI